MSLNNEHVGSKIVAKIKIYNLTRAELICSLCYEIPCSIIFTVINGNSVLEFRTYLVYHMHEGNLLNVPSKYLQCATITTGQLKMTLLRDNLQLTFYESYFAFCANIKLTIVQNWIEFLGKRVLPHV